MGEIIRKKKRWVIAKGWEKVGWTGGASRILRAVEMLSLMGDNELSCKLYILGDDDLSI